MALQSRKTSSSGRSDWFRRYLLPGLAFKAVVIGGGYATGRELAEFFLPAGAWGGVFGMLLAAAIWSGVCVLTFLFARATHSLDYRSFFRALLGPFWVLFELSYLMLLIVMLAVFGAAAGAIGQALFGAPLLAGTLLLVLLIAAFAAWGNESVEELFKYVSFLLYGVYAVFLALAWTRFGDRIGAAFAQPALTHEWMQGGVTYAGYNLVGAVVILPVVRHLRSSRDAIGAGLLAGPLAMVPALLFFVCMAAWPEVRSNVLPSDFLVGQLQLPWVRLVFQVMIFAALLESGTASVHAVNQRIAGAFWGGAMSRKRRLTVSLAILTGSVFLADRFGLVQLIARGYRYLSYAMLIIYVAPLCTLGVTHIVRSRRLAAAHSLDSHA